MDEVRLIDAEGENGKLNGSLQKNGISQEKIVQYRENIEKLIDKMKKMDYIRFVIMCREFIENNLDLTYIKLSAIEMINDTVEGEDTDGE